MAFPAPHSTVHRGAQAAETTVCHNYTSTAFRTSTKYPRTLSEPRPSPRFSPTGRRPPVEHTGVLHCLISVPSCPHTKHSLQATVYCDRHREPWERDSIAYQHVRPGRTEGSRGGSCKKNVEVCAEADTA